MSKNEPDRSRAAYWWAAGVIVPLVVALITVAGQCFGSRSNAEQGGSVNVHTEGERSPAVVGDEARIEYKSSNASD